MPPRCPNGTRRNKKTTLCEKTKSPASKKSDTQKKRKEANLAKKEALVKKYNDCVVKLNKIILPADMFNMTNRRKHHVAITRCAKIKDQIENLDTNKTLSENAVDQMIENYENVIDENDDIPNIKRKLMSLTYDKKYICSFTGKKAENLYHMAQDKLDCYLKYGDEIAP